ncbi:Oidioi.mRNA.OKI2018_I69.chr1.g3047.t1.cds [Oikopleura dioica]|uniref:Oidioi.mRNA.OKI2018_I69.chr1.g3047.t1.cds n=1 Tax=Oikopleura dioica TaxID=34765 RepID=A0ABN7SX66_OIKDI|nr:Oidioi.mRNA.OKI2018_I69.chr1.g3047.t1.cds [Oikopleura dioica]
MIFNGVCVKCVGTINMRTLEGQAKLEFYPEYAKYELEMTPKAAPDDQDSMAPHSSGDVNQQMEHMHTPTVKHENQLSSPASSF